VSTCEWCDVPTVAETPLLQDRMDLHRVFHAIGAVHRVEHQPITHTERRLTSA